MHAFDVKHNRTEADDTQAADSLSTPQNVIASEPRAPLCEGESGAMNCDLLRWAAAQDDLSPHLQGILLRLTKNMDEYGKLALPQAEIAANIRLGATQTRAAIKALVDAGALIRVRRGSVGKGRSCDLLMVDFSRNYDNNGASAVSLDNTEIPTLPALSEKSQNDDSAEHSVLSRRRSAGRAAFSAVDNSAAPCISTAARAETQTSNTRASDQIGSDRIEQITDAMIKALIARAGAAADPTRGGLLHAGDLTRYLRGGCTWEDIEFATDKLAASFQRRGARFWSWELLEEHVVKIRDRRVAGLPPPAPVKPQPRYSNNRGPYRANGITPLVAVG